ncbi:MAG TPA: hypothetical protein DCR40_21235 [Prolixibacteraceae bacterium]|nr:hypothetical protein [Prolixibacteraceae bacterium]
MSVTHSITGGLVHLSGNPIQITLTADAVKANHKLAVKVTCDALLGSPFVEEIAPNRPNLQSVFDISGFIDQPVNYNFDFPAAGVANPHDLLAFHVTLDIGEVWTDLNGDRQVEWMGISGNNQIRVIKGKLRPYELGLLNDAGKSFFSEYITGGKFLTHLPNYQKVAPHQIPLLWYLSRWTENHAVTANFKVETDNKVGHIPMTQDFTLWEITGLVDFAVQPAHWGFQTDPGELIQSYEFWLSDVTGDISEHRTFLVDNEYYEKSFLFYYVNPLSGVDCIWLTGPYSEGLKTESEIAYRAVPVLSGSKVASQTTISENSQRSWELNTGPKSAGEILALRDFLSAKQCWMVDPANGQKLIPVNIDPGDHKLFDSGEDIQNLDIKILEAHK